MNETVKSIFRQREIEKLYELSVEQKLTNSCYEYITSTIIEAIPNNTNVLSDKEIGSYNVEIPMLEIGDKFFLHDIRQVFTIKDKMRSSDGSITYYVEDKLVETENTHTSFEECSRKIEHWNHDDKELHELKVKLTSIEREFQNYKNKYKYENRFFNKAHKIDETYPF